MLRVYGLKNCDTCRKARKWLDGLGIAHDFVDVRADGVGRDDVARWADAAGIETLLNRRGTTWRGLSDTDKAKAETVSGAVALMTEHPALIKRPVFEDGEVVLIGFDKTVQATLEG